MADAASTSILDKVSSAIGNLTTIKVITVVGPLKVTANTAAGDEFVVTAQGEAEKPGYRAMISTLDVIGGDVVNAMDKDFISSDPATGLATLRTFHEEQVKIAVKQFQDNAKGMIDLARSLAGTPK